MLDRIRAANEAVSIYDLLAERGQVVGRDRPRKILCPVHDDRHKSAQVYPESNEIYCWTCGQTYDPVGVLVAEGMSWQDACAWIEGRVGVVYERVARPEDDFWRMVRKAQARDGRPVSYSEKFAYRWALHETVLKLGNEVDWDEFDDAHLDVERLERWRRSALANFTSGVGA
jgi:hypothetical protein